LVQRKSADQVLDSISPNPSIRAASDEANLDSGAPSVEKLIQAIYDKAEVLDPESQSYLKHLWSKLNRPSSDRVGEISERIRQLRSEFDANLNPEDDGLWFSEAELISVPRAKVKGFAKSTGTNEGKFYAKFRTHQYEAVIIHATDPSTRKRAFIERDNMVRKAL
jgi:metallopeptidase MepB